MNSTTAIPLKLTINTDMPGYTGFSLSLNNYLSVIIGPNGSGKSQILRAMKGALRSILKNKKVRLLSSGRLSSIEPYRQITEHYLEKPHYQEASFGNKDSTLHRHLYEDIKGDFQTLHVRKDIFLKIQTRLNSFFGRSIELVWVNGILKAHFKKEDDVLSYNSSQEASGLLHLVGILAALYDDEVGALLVDEPEISLHPQFQQFMFNEFRKFSGNPEEPLKKFIIISTHSPEMFDIEDVNDLCSFIFCTSISSWPKQINLDEDFLKNKKIREIITRIGHEHKTALFCMNPIFVEGPSDAIICRALTRKFGIPLEIAGSQVVPIIGKGNYTSIIKLFRMIGKNPILLTDADTLIDDSTILHVLANKQECNIDANSKGHKDFSDFYSKVKNSFSSLYNKYTNELIKVSSSHPYMCIDSDSSNNEASDDIKQKRAVFCTILDHSYVESMDVPFKSELECVQTQIESLLDTMKKGGCFILRKGFIECYYNIQNSKPQKEGKPSAAVQESISIMETDTAELSNKYRDILCALTYASKSIILDESKLLRDIIYSTISPAIGRLRLGENINSVYTLNNSDDDEIKLLQFTFDNDDSQKKIHVSLLSNVLEIDGLPITIDVDNDLFAQINKTIKRKNN